MPDFQVLTQVSDVPHLLAGDLIIIAVILFLFAMVIAVTVGVPLHFAYLVGYDHGATAERKDFRAMQQKDKVRALQDEIRDLKREGRVHSQNTVFLAREG